MWGLPKCKSNKETPPVTVQPAPATPQPLPQQSAETGATANTTAASTTATVTVPAPVVVEPTPSIPSPVPRLIPKPMSVKTAARPAARPVPVPSVEQTVPFNPDGGNTGQVASEASVKNVWTVTGDVKLRGTPGLDGKLLGKIPKGIQLTYLNVKTDKTQKLTVDGTEQDEPWLKVRTPRGTVGWVYGGVVRFYKK